MSDTDRRRKYSEHEKLRVVSEDSNRIGEFLEWLLNDKNWVIAEYDHRDKLEPKYFRRGVEGILAEYFDIDLNKVQVEKDQMLEEIRFENKLRNS